MPLAPGTLAVTASTMTAATVEPTSAAMEAAATVEPASAAMEAAATVKSTARISAAADEAASARKATSTIKAASTIETTSVAPAPPVAPTSAPSTPAPSSPTPGSSPAIPGAGTDEEAINEPVGPVIAIRRACVRIVAVVPISTVGWGITDSNSHRDLCVRWLRNRQRQRQYCNQCQVFCVLHGHPLWQIQSFRSACFPLSQLSLFSESLY